MRELDRRTKPRSEGTADALRPFAMNEEENDNVILLEQRVLGAEDLVEEELEMVDDDDYNPTEEVILLDMMRLDPADLEVA